MARNPHGTLTKGNLEWGHTHRKEEDRLRGLNNRGRRQAIEDQLSDDDVTTCKACGRFNCLFDANSYDDGPEALDWYDL